MEAENPSLPQPSRPHPDKPYPIQTPTPTPAAPSPPPSSPPTGGWFHTGDQGWLDSEGYLTLTGRIKELINRGGEKISPIEVRACWGCVVSCSPFLLASRADRLGWREEVALQCDWCKEWAALKPSGACASQLPCHTRWPHTMSHAPFLPTGGQRAAGAPGGGRGRVVRCPRRSVGCSSCQCLPSSYSAPARWNSTECPALPALQPV